jgi:anti-anti-sigma factor
MATVNNDPTRAPDPNRGRPRIDVRLSPLDYYAATVVLMGDHDLATAEAVRVALAPLYGRVLVDLSDCSFIDSTVIGLLIEKSQDLTRDGYALELLVDGSGTSYVARTLAQIGVDKLMPIRHASIVVTPNGI